MKSLAEQIGGKCVHYNGTQNNVCRAGLVYATINREPTKGQLPFSNMACFREGAAVPCEKRHFPTPEEVAAKVADHDARREKMKLGIGAAREDAKKHGFKKGNGGNGFVRCPVCKTGDLYYTVASYNGHMWGRCQTQGCVSWME